jgi:hypothetical protein
MFDELERLRECEALARLLDHYAQAGGNDREAWQDRVMHLEGVDARELVKLHGELIAHDWVEQNTGMTPVLKAGVAACCYRITASGIRAAKWARRTCLAPDGAEPEAA